MLRKEIVSLTDIRDVASKYVELVREGDRYQCKCPFHHGPQPTMSVSPATGNYGCKICGERGDLVDLMMKLEGLTYKEVFERLSVRLKYETKGTVYVLELEDGFYYVGYTLDLVNRMQQHFNGQGALWTKIHRPVRLVDVYYSVTYAQENIVTKRYFDYFGKDRVRGGSYCWC